MPLRAFIATLLLGVFASQARAADIIGYGEAYNVLYSVDLTTQTAVQIGGSGLINGQQTPSIITGLTFNPAGTLYAVWDAGPTKILVTVDKATGLVASVGNLNVNTSAQLDLALAFTSDGNLWMSSSDGRIWSVDPGTAAITLVATNPGVKITGLAAKGMALYGAGGLGNNNFYSIDTGKGTAALIGTYGTSNAISFVSPGFDSSGQLWGILDYIPPLNGASSVQWSDLARIAPASGALTDLGKITPPSTYAQNSPTFQNLSYVGIRGLAIAPNINAAQNTVSTPTLSWRGIAALIALIGLLGGTRLHRRRPSR